jgi:hypothetical protein
MTLDLFPAMKMTAKFSDCRTYRYLFGRVWDDSLRILPVAMLNPSRADADRNDPTVTTLIHFAKLWGYGGLSGANLAALVSSQPRVMMAHPDPIGPENDQHIAQLLNLARHTGTPVLAAWGNGGSFRGRDEWFINRARAAFVDLVCLGVTKDGFPKHPAARGTHRIPRDQQPILWKPWREPADQ